MTGSQISQRKEPYSPKTGFSHTFKPENLGKKRTASALYLLFLFVYLFDELKGEKHENFGPNRGEVKSICVGFVVAGYWLPNEKL